MMLGNRVSRFVQFALRMWVAVSERSLQSAFNGVLADDTKRGLRLFFFFCEDSSDFPEPFRNHSA